MNKFYRYFPLENTIGKISIPLKILSRFTNCCTGQLTIFNLNPEIQQLWIYIEPFAVHRPKSLKTPEGQAFLPAWVNEGILKI